MTPDERALLHAQERHDAELEAESAPDVVLYIDRSTSTCGACGDTCLPTERAHITSCGWDQHPGCGAVYTHLSSHYWGGDIESAACAMRPDLIPLFHGGIR